MKFNWHRTFALLVLLFLLDAFNYTTAQQVNCNSRVMSKSYYGSGSANPHFIEPLPGKQYLVGGIINGSFSLLKLTEDLDTIWTKRFYQVANNENAGMTGFLQDKSGNYLMALRNNVFIKTDTSGAVLYGKEINFPTTYPSPVFTAWEYALDGDIIILFKDSNSSESCYLLKISPDFSTVKWMKFFRFQETIYSGTEMIKLSVVGNNVFVTGTVQMTFNDRRGTLLKFNVSNGVLAIAKSYKIDNKTETNFTDIQSYNGGLVIKSRVNVGGINYTNNVHAIVRVDSNLNLLKAYRFTNVTNTDAIVIDSVEADGGFFVGGLDNNTSDYYFYIDKNDSVIWKSNSSRIFYPRGLRSVLSANDFRFGLSSANFNDVVTSTNKFFWLISKRDFYGNLYGSPSQCPYFQKNVGIAATDSLSAAIVPIVKDTSVNIKSVTITKQPFYFIEIYGGCESTSSCNNLKIIGDTFPCNNTQFALSAKRNSVCIVPVKWQVIQGPAVEQTYLTDSSVKFNYTQFGVYTIVAYLAGSCSIITDTIIIHVSINNTAFSLGPDISLCKGDSAVLQVVGGFQNYSWSNGAVTPTIKVKDAGFYSLTAIDFCGNIYKDTIQVLLYPAQKSGLVKDTLMCPYDTLKFQLPASFTNINWTPANIASVNNANLFSIFTNTPQQLMVQSKDNNNCWVKDTINVSIKAIPALDLGVDTTICDRDSITLTAPSSFIYYNWSTGVTTNVIKVFTPDIYWLSATASNGCKAKDTIRVFIRPLPIFDLGIDTSVCANTSITFNAPIHNGYTYSWQDGDSFSYYTASNIGTYFVIIKDSFNCKYSDTVKIKAIKPVPFNFLPKDTSICPDFTIEIKTSNSFMSYLWGDGNINSFMDVRQAGQYILTVTDFNGCKGKDTINIFKQLSCIKAIYFPNAFSPNKDQLNDTYKPKAWGLLKEYHLRIYNRWGQLSFETRNIKDGWDGVFNSIPQDRGIFVWVCNYQFVGEDLKQEKGTLLLVR